ncbi:hypothetical protein GCM10009680_56620 [Streptomyces yatensis]|uniref:Uncharacterized protein n=1 Tax=Streptomyces yatensis TaxID=155177 RepID=A0ABN2IN86_9ACTN
MHSDRNMPQKHRRCSTGIPWRIRRVSHEELGGHQSRTREHGAPVNTSMLRCLLSPLTSWRAWRLARASGGNLSFDTAWRRTRLERHPDEMPYQQHGHIPGDSGVDDVAEWRR